MDRRKKEEGKQKGGRGSVGEEWGDLGVGWAVVVDRKEGKGFGEGRKANTKKVNC